VNGLGAETALGYVARGWPVFPCRPWPSKRPLTQHGFYDASHDSGQIRAWWTQWPDALIGVPTGKASGLVILDIDVKDGCRYGFDSLADLGRSILPQTPMAHTASGGLHVYFSAIATIIRNSEGELGPGLDVRGEGGYIIAPSPGSGYAWDPHWNFATVPLLPAPAWLGHRQRGPAATPKGKTHRLDPLRILATACDNIRRAANGERHRILNREAYTIGCLVRAGALAEGHGIHELEAATAAMAWASRGDRAKTERDLEDAFRDGVTGRSARR
jgi:hypothetical protein